jgi:hypothetical protein
MRRHIETVGWLAVLLAVSTGAIAVSRITAPPDKGGDMWDSPFFFHALVAVGVCAAGAGYRVRNMWVLFGIAAMLPYFAYQVQGGVMGGDGLWAVGLAFLVPLTAVPVLGAMVGATLSAIVSALAARRRQRGVTEQVSTLGRVGN